MVLFLSFFLFSLQFEKVKNFFLIIKLILFDLYSSSPASMSEGMEAVREQLGGAWPLAGLEPHHELRQISYRYLH